MVPAKLKELYATKNFGCGTAKRRNADLFLTTNDITGGNSGSPVMNGNGEDDRFSFRWQLGIAFRRHQLRQQPGNVVLLGYRYVLFIVEKLGGCKNLIDEMTIVE